MAIPDDLKFDVRVRDRLLHRGLVTEAEIDKHVKALPDLDAEAVDLTAKQPALQKESDRDIVIVRTSGVRPPIAPVSHDDVLGDDDDLDDDLDDVDDEDDDEDEETKIVDKKVLEAAAPEPVAEAVAEKPAADADDAAEPAAEPAAESEPKKEGEAASDDDWGGG